VAAALTKTLNSQEWDIPLLVFFYLIRGGQHIIEVIDHCAFRLIFEGS